MLIDAPDGGTQSTALAAIKHGDIAAIGAVVTAGVPRFVGRSRNTPATTRKARVAIFARDAGLCRGGALGPAPACARCRTRETETATRWDTVADRDAWPHRKRTRIGGP